MATKRALDFYLACCQQTRCLPRAGRLSTSWELCLAKRVSSKKTNTLQNEMPEQMLRVLKPDICWSSLSNRRKAKSMLGSVTFLGWGGLISRIIFIIMSPLTQRHQADIEDKLIASWGNTQLEVAEVLLQMRVRGKESGQTEEWHLDLFCHLQYARTGSKVVTPPKTHGVRQTIQELHISFGDANHFENIL